MPRQKNISAEDVSKMNAAFMRKHITKIKHVIGRMTGAAPLPGGVSVSIIAGAHGF